MKKKLIAAALAVLAVIVALVAVNGSANAGATGRLAVGQILTNGTISIKVTSVSTDRHAGLAKDLTEARSVFNVRDTPNPGETTKTAWRISGTTIPVYVYANKSGGKGW